MIQTASLAEIKKHLASLDKSELVALCLHLAKFKKDSKELLHYLLFEAENEEAYILAIQEELEADFEAMNRATHYWMAKSIRKSLRKLKKYIRFSGQKETEIRLLIYFCQLLSKEKILLKSNKTMQNLYERQKNAAEKAMSKLHEDLQYDYEQELAQLPAF